MTCSRPYSKVHKRTHSKNIRNYKFAAYTDFRRFRCSQCDLSWFRFHEPESLDNCVKWELWLWQKSVCLIAFYNKRNGEQQLQQIECVSHLVASPNKVYFWYNIFRVYYSPRGLVHSMYVCMSVRCAHHSFFTWVAWLFGWRNFYWRTNSKCDRWEGLQ